MHSHKIYIVEDDELMRNTLEEACASSGYAVSSAGDGEVALDEIFKQEPDLILLDLNIPGKSGLVLLKELRAYSDWGSNVPVIILTNLDTDNGILDAVVEYHPSYYFVKSNVTPDVILEKVSECLSH